MEEDLGRGGGGWRIDTIVERVIDCIARAVGVDGEDETINIPFTAGGSDECRTGEDEAPGSAIEAVDGGIEGMEEAEVGAVGIDLIERSPAGGATGGRDAVDGGTGDDDGGESLGGTECAVGGSAFEGVEECDLGVRF